MHMYQRVEYDKQNASLWKARGNREGLPSGEKELGKFQVKRSSEFEWQNSWTTAQRLGACPNHLTLKCHRWNGSDPDMTMAFCDTMLLSCIRMSEWRLGTTVLLIKNRELCPGTERRGQNYCVDIIVRWKQRAKTLSNSHLRLSYLVSVGQLCAALKSPFARKRNHICPACLPRSCDEKQRRGCILPALWNPEAGQCVGRDD